MLSLQHNGKTYSNNNIKLLKFIDLQFCGLSHKGCNCETIVKKTSLA